MDKNTQQKPCNKCYIIKALDQFQKDPRNKDGLQGICTECRKIKKQEIHAQRLSGLNITPVDHKVCNKCGADKPISEYFADAGISDGHATICKQCKTEKSLEWRETNRERYNLGMREYRKKHSTKMRLQRYDLTEEQYTKMLEQQDHKCKICQCHPKGKRPLAVDHHHDTGTVRGLLCYGCNRAIAILDKPELLKKAMIYLSQD